METQHQIHEKWLRKKLPLFPPYIERYLKNNIGPKKPTTLFSYAKDIEQFLTWLIQEGYVQEKNIQSISLQTLEELYRDDIEDYRAFLRRQKSKKGDFYSVSTLNRKISTLKSLFRYLAITDNKETRQPYIKRNVMEQIPLLKNPNSTRDRRIENIRNGILVEEEIDSFRDFVLKGYGELVEIKQNKRKYNRWLQNRERDAAIISLLLGSGLRIAELTSITLKDLDLINRKVLVYRKSGRKSFVPYSKKAHDYLLRYLEIREERYKATDDSKEGLFLSIYNGQSKMMDKRSIQKMIVKYAESFGKPSLSAHKLRHTFATNHLAKINNVRVLQTLLDHASPATTAEYASVFESDVHESVDKADE